MAKFKITFVIGEEPSTKEVEAIDYDTNGEFIDFRRTKTAAAAPVLRVRTSDVKMIELLLESGSSS